MTKTSSSLKRQLGFWDSVAINVGIVIGVGIFRTPAEIAKYIDSSSWTLLFWFLGGIISLFGVWSYAEMSSRFPHTGGTYVFLKESYGKAIGFLFGWTEFSMLRAGSLAAIAYVLATYCRNLFGIGPGYEKFIAVSSIVVFTTINILGIHFGRGVQNVLSSLKVITILSMSSVIFFRGTQNSVQLSHFDHLDFHRFSVFAPALIPILFSYGGWNESTFMSGEFKETKKELPYSLVISSLIVTALYLLMNAAYLKMMDPSQIKQSTAIASDIFSNLFGATGKLIVTAAILTSACGALNSTILTGARIPFAMGQDHARFSFLSKVHGKYETPHTAMIVNSLWAATLVMMGNFEELLFFYGFAKWLFFTLAGCSLFIMRKKFKEPAHFEVPGYPVIPAVFAMTSAFLCAIVIIHAPKEAMIGAFLVSLGFPFYYFTKK